MYRVRALEQALQILAVLEVEPELTLPELGARIGTQTPNVHRLVLHLVEAGLVEASPLTKRYRLAPKRLGELSARALAGLNPWEALRQVVAGLKESTGMPGLIAVLSGGRAIYVEQFRGPERALGRAFPAHATALGKAILAFLPEPTREAVLAELVLDAWTPTTITDRERLREELAVIAERGYALEEGELDGPRRSVGAPVRDHTGAVIAAVGVGGGKAALPRAKTAAIAKIVVAEAERVSAALGASRVAAPPPRALTVEVLGAVEPPVPPPATGGQDESPAPRARRRPRAKRGSGKSP
ncbi:IclR family transcriptional regulator [Miltoncostaea marina]|uniref:IclR family transcriptional regulator n=1 Tax=Miltoncostaea marina TaxID=2843215 RepID=UPI001C3D1620|nr:IclR family transcriptional regulator [Miltoncostaea marina]